MEEPEGPGVPYPLVCSSDSDKGGGKASDSEEDDDSDEENLDYWRQVYEKLATKFSKGGGEGGGVPGRAGSLGGKEDGAPYADGFGGWGLWQRPDGSFWKPMWVQVDSEGRPLLPAVPKEITRAAVDSAYLCLDCVVAADEAKGQQGEAAAAVAAGLPSAGLGGVFKPLCGCCQASWPSSWGDA